MGEVLQIVDGQHDGPATDGGGRAASVVDEVGVAGVATQPGVLGEHASWPAGSGDRRSLRRIQRRQFGVGIDE